MPTAERLMIARQALGLTPAGLAQRAGMPEKSIIGYEAGSANPAHASLIKLAEALDVETGFLIREEPFINLMQLPSLDKVSEAERPTLIARTLLWLEHYLDAESWLEDSSDVVDFKYPAGFPIEASDGREAAQAAQTLREAWGVSTGQIASVGNLLEAWGIRVGILKGGDKFSACAFWAKDGDFQFPFITANAGLAGAMQRYAISRELAYLMVEGITAQTAGHFAGAFLMPERELRLDIGTERSTLSFAEVDLLVQKYGVSIRHLLIRALSLRVIQKSVYDAWMTNASAWQAAAPEAHVLQERADRAYQVVLRLLAEGVVEASEARHLLRLSPEQWEVLTAHNTRMKTMFNPEGV